MRHTYSLVDENDTHIGHAEHVAYAWGVELYDAQARVKTVAEAVAAVDALKAAMSRRFPAAKLDERTPPRLVAEDHRGIFVVLSYTITEGG